MPLGDWENLALVTISLTPGLQMTFMWVDVEKGENQGALNFFDLETAKEGGKNRQAAQSTTILNEVTFPIII